MLVHRPLATDIGGAREQYARRQRERDPDARRQVVGKLHAWRSFSEAGAGVGCSIVFLWWSMQELVIVQVIVGWLPLLLAMRLREPPVERLPASAGHAGNMLRILRHMLLGDAVLRLTFFAICIWGLTTFYAVWLIQKRWELDGVWLAHFGYLWGALTMDDIADDHVGPMLNPPHLGELIRESMDDVGWNVTETAGRLGCERGTLSRLLNGKASVSENMALEDIGWGTADHWMRMQASYELARVRRDRAAAERRAGALHA